MASSGNGWLREANYDRHVTIVNLSAALVAIGVDELDFTLSVTGDFTGGATGTDLALGSGIAEQVFLDTSTPGMKSGVIASAR